MRSRKHPVVRKIEPEIKQTVEDFGYELVQIKYGGEAGGRTLSILIDHPEDITADDCSEMSRRLSMMLDTLDPIPGAYTLIVSSPGLDRPLTRDSDFDRFAGEMAAIRHRSDEGERRTDTGTLEGIEDGNVTIRTEESVMHIPLDEIEEAHLVYDWDAEESD